VDDLIDAMPARLTGSDGLDLGDDGTVEVGPTSVPLPPAWSA
jgi:hypothetical protein